METLCQKLRRLHIRIPHLPKERRKGGRAVPPNRVKARPRTSAGNTNCGKATKSPQFTIYIRLQTSAPEDTKASSPWHGILAHRSANLPLVVGGRDLGMLLLLWHSWIWEDYTCLNNCRFDVSILHGGEYGDLLLLL